MKRLTVVALLTLALTPAHAQVQCGEPLTGADAKYAEDYARNITKPLIEHNAGGLGPVLWAYIAGQARAESLANMRDENGSFVFKPNNNLWNVQTDATKECSSTTMVGCLPHNVGKPYVANGKVAAVGQCWLENGNPMQWVKVCFPSYPSLDAAADDYLKRRPNYTNELKQLAKGNPTPEQFFNALKNAHWSDQAAKPAYKTDTLAAIDQVMRGLATLRAADTKALGDTSNEIDAWCSKGGMGDAAERKALADKQAALLKSLAVVGKVCAAPSGATPPQANSAIDSCRNDPAPPAPPTPTSTQQAPAGRATGKGEPHYLLPTGQTLSTQRAGEFWLLSSPDGTQVQVRQAPWSRSRSVSAITAMAAKVGTHRVGVYEGGRLLIDGKAATWTGTFWQTALSRDATLGVWGSSNQPTTVALMWTNGRVLRIRVHTSWLDVETSWAKGSSTEKEGGLIGRNSNGAVLIGRTGKQGRLDHANEADAFVSSWRINPQESLFDYAPGQSYATFDLRDFPYAPAAPTASELDKARQQCIDAGVPASEVAACAFDLAVTGSGEFLASYERDRVPQDTPAEAPKTNYTIEKAVFVPDLAHMVSTLPNDTRVDMTVAAGESRTYRIDANRKGPTVYLHVYTRDLSCLGQSDFDGTTPAMQVFNAKGQAISKAVKICMDTLGADVEPGDYYLVVHGANQGPPVSFKVEAFAYN
ncbi:hypothetical protein [Cognatilysobacter terrigena]|uniref:hypothetical protein n=1 Tax=Cognatilysobacter terrigena TaxID=2488749 RepID=UPI001060EE3E|nr:hypothetical protein [Lysobacter terrigena]